MFKRRWWRRILVGVILLLVIGIAGYFIDRELTFAANEKLLAKVLAETDALDPGWRWEEIEAKREQVPDGENAAIVIQRTNDLLGPKWSQIQQAVPVQVPMVSTRDHLDEDSLEKMRSLLKEFRPAVDESLPLARYTRARYPIVLLPVVVNTRVDLIQKTRNLAYLHAMRLRVALVDHRPKETLESLKVIFHVADSLRDEPFLITLLVRIAIEHIFVESLQCVLSVTELGAELEQFLPLLDQAIEEPRFWKTMRSERAIFNRLFENFEKGIISIIREAKEHPQSLSLMEWLSEFNYKQYLPVDHSHTLKIFNDLIEKVRNPESNYLDEFDRFDIPPLGNENICTRHLFPGFQKIYAASLRNRASLRSTKVAILVERYRQKHNRWPASLEDLKDQHFQSIPKDPYDGNSFRYRILEDGVVIYSVGPNGVDDGGNLSINPQKDDATDYGFRLWNLEERRKPLSSKPELLPNPQEKDN
jgi:hypothetical protein